MLPRKFRLPVADFKNKGSSSVKTQRLTARFSSNQLNYNRFAVIISAKTEPKSVRRHAVKRKIFAVVGKWPALGCDVLFTVFQNDKKLNLVDLKKYLQKELEQVLLKLSHG